MNFGVIFLILILRFCYKMLQIYYDAEKPLVMVYNWSFDLYSAYSGWKPQRPQSKQIHSTTHGYVLTKFLITDD